MYLKIIMIYCYHYICRFYSSKVAKNQALRSAQFIMTPQLNVSLPPSQECLRLFVTMRQLSNDVMDLPNIV